MHTHLHEHPLQEELHAVGAELGATKAERDAAAVAAREQQQAAAAQVCSCLVPSCLRVNAFKHYTLCQSLRHSIFLITFS